MKKLLSIIGGIISFVICIALLCMQMSFLTFLSFKTLLTEKTMYKMFEQVNIVSLINESADSKTKEEIYKVSGSLGLTIDETNKILETDSFKSFAAKYISNNIKAINSNSKIVMSAEDIKTLISDVEKEADITIGNKNKLLEMINENSTEIEKALNISSNIKTQMNDETLTIVKGLFNNTMYIGFTIVFVLLFLLLALFRWSMYKPFIWYGITSIITGLLFLLPSISLKTVLPYMVNLDLKKYEAYDNVIKVIQSKATLFSILTIIAGIFMIIVYALIKKNVKKEKQDFKVLNSDNAASV